MESKTLAATAVTLLLFLGGLTACDQPPQQESQAPAAGQEQPEQPATQGTND